MRGDSATSFGPPWAACTLGLVESSWARPPSTPWETMASYLRAPSGAMPAGTRGAARHHAPGRNITQSYQILRILSWWCGVSGLSFFA